MSVVVFSLIFIFNVVWCNQVSEDELLDRIERARASSDFVRCWLVPETPDLNLEGPDAFELRLKGCELYYKQFLARRFSSWGKFGALMRRWMDVVESEMEINSIDKIHKILTNNLVNLPMLKFKLQQEINLPVDGDNWSRYQRMYLMQAFERGDGICVDLFLPPMGRFWNLLHGIDKIILNRTTRPLSSFMEKFLNDVIPNDLLIIHLSQHICDSNGDSHFVFHEGQDDFIYRNHLGHEDVMPDYIDMWLNQVLLGRCEYNNMFAMRLVHEFRRIMENDIYDISFIRDFKKISNMLFENCVRVVNKSSTIVQQLELAFANKERTFEIYRTSWKLMNLLHRWVQFHSTDTWLSLIDIRSARPVNAIDRLFFETNDPQMVDAYTQGTGLCLSNRENIFRNEDERLLFLRTFDRLLSVRGYRPIHSSRLLAFYLMITICDQAYLLPLVGPDHQH